MLFIATNKNFSIDYERHSRLGSMGLILKMIDERAEKDFIV